MRIAVVGSGIAGHSAALALHRAPAGHEVTLFEREPRAGGHSATVEIEYLGRTIAVDTGFIVYNTLNYPNLTAFFDWAGVETQASNMSFSVSADQGRFEWCGRDGGNVWSGLFAQWRNAVSPSFLMMLRDILRFQNQARADRRDGTIGPGSLRDYLARHQFGPRVIRDYLVPMGAAIWSTSPAAMLDFPAQSFIDFFDNHCLLQWERPKWRTVTGGSRRYVARMAALLDGRVRLSTPATAVRRTPDGVELAYSGGVERFDHVILACHAPQVLALLADADAQERAALSPMRTSRNDVYLHCDPRLMPKRRAAWAAWNFLRDGADEAAPVCVSYWMNLLQGIEYSRPLFITLNPPRPPARELTFGHYTYAHPQFDAPALKARALLAAVQGRRGVSFCGAWTAHGFHEDGMASGLAAAARLGASAPWLADGAPARAPSAAMAEAML